MRGGRFSVALGFLSWPTGLAMLWLYRLQQRLAITRRESLAILTLTGLFLVGWTVRHVQDQRTPPLEAAPLVAVPIDSAVATTVSSTVSRGPVNVNTASKEQLQTLSGIGPALSQRIVDYRERHRPFERVDELQRVRGIGPKTLASLRSRIVVTEPSNDDAADVRSADSGS